MWAKAREGAAILGDLGAYTKLVLLPQLGGYVAKVGVIVVFLAAYDIPVSFGSVMSVLGSNQLANLLSLTPGGVGVNQAFNSFALENYRTHETATGLVANSVTTAFNTASHVLICIVFGARWLGAGQSLFLGEGEGSEMKRAAREGTQAARSNGRPGCWGDASRGGNEKT